MRQHLEEVLISLYATSEMKYAKKKIIKKIKKEAGVTVLTCLLLTWVDGAYYEALLHRLKDKWNQ